METRFLIIIIIIALFAFMKHQRIQYHLSRSAHLQMGHRSHTKHNNSKSTIFSLFAKTTFFKKEFTRVGPVWLLFLEILDPNAPK